VLVRLRGGTPDGWNRLYLDAVAVGSVLYGWAGLVLVYLTTRGEGRGPALAAVLGLAFGTFLYWYLAFAPTMAHAMAFGAAALFLWLWLRPDLSGTRRALWLGAAAGLCALTRWSSALIVLLPIVEGTVFKSAGSFRIDHPLDPANKYLCHSCVESPDSKNIYDGITITDGNGEATVTLPGYFEALNRDFRYQLTAIGQFAQVIVSRKIKDNHFSIKTDRPGVEVSWQVTGIRQDAYKKAHPTVVEQDKPAHERGTYQRPELFGQPEEKGLAWKHNPELRERLNEEAANRQCPSPNENWQEDRLEPCCENSRRRKKTNRSAARVAQFGLGRFPRQD
jgi:hypothetical protein